MNKLENLGYSDWFISQGDAGALAAHEVARVVAVHKNSYLISKGDGEVFAECSGNLLYLSDSRLDLPTTGDWVYADFYDEDALAIIHGLLPRRTLLKRKTAGKRVDFQLIAANIDVALIIQSADCNFNPRRLERYLAMVNENGIVPMVLLSKSDCAPAERLAEMKEDIARVAPGVAMTAFSNLTGENIDAVKSLLSPRMTYCLLGSSGVGKTTLINTLTGIEKFQTQPVSAKQNKGRHTTTSRELVQLDKGALLIDTPGMRELGNMSIEAGIEETFAEIVELTEQCKFRDCSHNGEEGCAVLAAIENGSLAEQRYRNFVKMKNESAFHDMSYFEKRRKDKNFGKMVKSVMKDKKKR